MTPTMRSPWSARFEIRVRSLMLSGDEINEAMLEASDRLAAFQPHLALVDIDSHRGRLLLKYAGAKLAELFDPFLPDENYLDFMRLDLRAATLATARRMIEQPCGYWQLTPLATGDGKDVVVEYTAFPARPRGGSLLAVFAFPLPGHATDTVIAEVKPATARSWIDIGFGVPSAERSTNRS